MRNKEQRVREVLPGLIEATSGNKINVYTCETCGNSIVTVDREDGVTSMTLKCRAVSTCQGRMFSCMYRVPQHLKPTWEWYKPVGAELDGLTESQRDHVQQGGLMLRKILSDEAEAKEQARATAKRLGVLKVKGWRKGNR